MSKVLVADDEEIIRELAKEVLEAEGYEVITAEDGSAALSKIAEGGIDLLLTDIKMPEIDGLRLIREAKKVIPDLLSIIMTGYATIETARKAIREGAYDYLLKPFNLVDLRMAVTKAFQRKRLEEENARLKQLTALFEVSQKLSGTVERDNLLNLLLRSAIAQTKALGGEIWLIDDRKPRRAAALGANLNLNGVVREAVHNGKPISISSKEGEVVFIPLISGRKVLGGIALGKDGTGFSQGDRELLHLLANQAAISLENSYLFSNLQDAYFSTIKSLSLLLEANDPYIKGHSQRVTELCLRLGRELELNEEGMETLRQAAPLHDIGKIAVSNDILHKREELNPDDWEAIKSHPIVGDEVLAPIGFLYRARKLVRHHHERMDGKGYPDGLSEGDLDLPTKIIIVADAYDAMASDRPYRKRLPNKRIIKEFRDNEGTQFDPLVVHTLLELLN